MGSSGGSSGGSSSFGGSFGGGSSSGGSSGGGSGDSGFGPNDSHRIKVKQTHESAGAGETEQTSSEEEPHRLIHEVRKPIIQEEIQPVQEEIHTIVAKGEGRRSFDKSQSKAGGGGSSGAGRPASPAQRAQTSGGGGGGSIGGGASYGGSSSSSRGGSSSSGGSSGFESFEQKRY
ncbi:hypothetical protein TYRP_014229 [Tyrophagus putrescentiae]|nr:hypothetical protein TYRP_014229 [Tyrophagus putrescentiae]